MKHYLILPLFTFIFLSNTHYVSAQILALGYRSHFGGMQAFQDVMAYYNENRPWLDNSLSTSAYMHGIELGLGGSREKYGYTLGRVYAQFGNTRAKGTSNNIDYVRTVSTRIIGIEFIDAWYTPLHLKDFNIGFGIMPLGLGFFRLKTALNGDQKKMPLTDFSTGILSSSHFYTNLHIDITKVTAKDHSIQFQLFHSIGPKQEYELVYLNQELSPATHAAFGRRTLMKINNWGMKFIYSY